MPDVVVPADAGMSSGAATPVADAALAGAAVGGGTDVGGEATPMSTPKAAVAAGKMNEDGSLFLDTDGEPVPVGNAAQQRVAQMIAEQFKKDDSGKFVNPSADLNREIKEFVADHQKQSTPGPTPAEVKPTEQPGSSPPVNVVKAHVKAKGEVTPPPAAPAQG